MSLSRVWMAGLLLAALSHAALAGEPPAEPVIKITAKKFEFSPQKIVLHVNKLVVLELRSLDRKHGFSVPDLGIRVDILPDKPTLVRVRPTKVGKFAVHCDVFCGEGHEDMTGEIEVVP
ncbi:MAG TPA: cupredoxin domain-containing protein [Polyangia bacterium]|nr:cupredoxin domain-containing protein [Polyangia bacterium]